MNTQFKLTDTQERLNSKHVKIKTTSVVNEILCLSCKQPICSDIIIDDDGIYTCPNCNKWSSETGAHKGVICTAQISTSDDVEDFFLPQNLVDKNSGLKQLLIKKNFKFIFSDGEEVIDVNEVS